MLVYQRVYQSECEHSNMVTKHSFVLEILLPNNVAKYLYTHMLNVWNIYLHLPNKWPSHVGKYTTHGASGIDQHCLQTMLWTKPTPTDLVVLTLD